MPTFAYKAKLIGGEATTGEIEAPTQAAASAQLKEQALVVLSLREAKGRGLEASLANLISGVPKREVVVFARQLATMIGANVPVVRALRILVRQTKTKAFKRILTDVADEVDGGAKLSRSLGRHPKVFDDLFVYMVRAGETTGKLDDVLSYLADQKERDYELRGKIISAMIYPAIILIGLIVVFIVMMVFVIPKLVDVIVQTGAEIPLATRALILVSNTFTNYWYLLLAALILLIVGYVFTNRSPAGRMVLGRIYLKAPVFGELFQKIQLSRVARSLGNLLSSGVPINKSLLIAADIAGNPVYKTAIRRAAAEVETGKTLSVALGLSKYIPLMMVQMIGVGEETGRLDMILGKVAERRTSNLVVLIEPFVILSLGVGVLVLIAGILLPIFNISSQF